MLISCPEERQRRTERKQSAVLKWLRDETWTTVEIIAERLDVSRQAAWKTLKQMEIAGYVRVAKFDLVGRSQLALWGITPHGLAYAWDLDEDVEDRSIFEPSRVALSMVPHNLDLQKARLRAEQSGWMEWVRGERLGFKVSNRPDAVARDAKGVLVAIELERTVKTLKRYRQIMAAHLQQIKVEKWSRIEYVCPQESMVPRLEKIFRKIDYVSVSKQRVPVMEKHRARFSFHHLERWPSTTQKPFK